MNIKELNESVRNNQKKELEKKDRRDRRRYYMESRQRF